MYLKKKRTTSLLMAALFSTSLLQASVMHEATAAIVQQHAVCKGTVIDTHGEPVVGASVFVVSKGQKKGSVTDLDGNFEISGVSPGSMVTISYVGFKTQQLPWNGKDLKVTLQESSEMLENVVVVGYGTQKKVNLTGAVSVVSSKTLEARPVTSVAQALQGEVPGLNFTVGNAGGSLNSRMSMNIRGIGSIGEGSNAAPLVLIDGSEGDLYSIAPNDIESISVLKDASSSAIYGSRAAFGVILVTTKSGKDSRMNVSYNGNVRFSTATQVPDMPNAYDFARYWNDAAANNGSSVPFGDALLAKIKDRVESNVKPGDEITTTWAGTEANEPWSMYYNSWNNVDWFEEMYSKNVPSTEHNISLSGGGSKVNYYLSGALLSQKGLIRHGEDKLKRYNFSGKITANLKDWFTVTYNTKWVREDYSRPSYMTDLFFHNIARRWPTNPIYDPHGNYVHGNEILQMENGGKDANQSDKLYQQLALEFRPIKGWKIRLEGNYNTVHNHNHWDVLPIYYYDQDNRPVAAAWSGEYAAGKSNVGESMSKNNYYNGRFFTEYAFTLKDKHDFKFLAGLDMESNIYTSLGASRADLITPAVPTLNNATHKDVKPSFSNNHWSTMGAFGRINYAYDTRYLFEFSIRRDGSSRFIGDKTWGTFPSVALGWNIANEKFFKPLTKTVNTLKLRGTYGALGNTNISALYPWFLGQPVSASSSAWLVNGERVNTSNAPGLVSPFLTWESIRSWNVGVDFGLFNNKLQGNFDYYVRTTKDMVGPAPAQPSILGADLPKQNNSDMRSNGWDLEVRWRDRIGEVGYGIKLVLSDDYQTITRYYNPNHLLSKWSEGKRMGDIYGYLVEGIAQSNEQMTEWLKTNKPAWGSDWAAGDVMYKDLNGDNKVNNGKGTYDDMGDLVKIGNSLPRYRFGITLDANWKGFDFLIFLQGVGKRDFWDNSTYSTGANTGMWASAAFKDHLDYWRPATDTNFGPNPNGFYPRPLFHKGGKNFQTSDRYLQNAAYMRIKNIQLGYTLPAAVSSKIGASRVRFYFSAENLATFTKMNKIFDPEATGGGWGAGKIYPLQRAISFGLNLNF